MYIVHPISAMLKESHFYRYNKFEIESPFYKEDEGFGWWKLLEDTPYTTGEEKLAGWNSADDAKKGREKIASVEERVAEEESKEEEEESEEEAVCVVCGSPESYRLKEPLCKSWKGPCFYGWDCVNALCFKMTHM